MAIQDKTLRGAEHDWYATRSALPGNAPLGDHKAAYYASKGFGGVGKPISQMEDEWLASLGRKFGTSLSFDGSSFIDNGVPAAVNSLDVALTVSIWVKPSVTNRQDYVGQWPAPATTGYKFLLTQGVTSSKFEFYCNSNGINGYSSGVPTATFTPGLWYNVVGVYDGLNSVKLYVNGSLGASASSGFNSGTLYTAGTTKLFEGKSAEGNPFTGKMDDVRIYGRVLSPTEITNLYYGIEPDTTNLVFWHKYNEGSGSSATDSSVSNITGTITGATYSTDVPIVSGSSNQPFELWLNACQGQFVTPGKTINDCKMRFFTSVASGINP